MENYSTIVAGMSLALVVGTIRQYVSSLHDRLDIVVIYINHIRLLLYVYTKFITLEMSVKKCENEYIIYHLHVTNVTIIL